MLKVGTSFDTDVDHILEDGVLIPDLSPLPRSLRTGVGGPRPQLENVVPLSSPPLTQSLRSPTGRTPVLHRDNP